MDDNERKIRIQELNDLKKELLDKEVNETGTNQNKVMIKSNGKSIIPKEEIINLNDYFDRKAGMINIVSLSLLTFVFECLFLFLSFMIFK